MVLRVFAINTVSLARIRAVIAILMLMVLASCASNGAREAEIALQKAEVVAASEASAKAAQEAHRESVARMNRQKEEQEAEQVRLQERRDKEQARRVEAEKIKVQEAQLLAAKAEPQAPQAREQKIAAAAARRQAKIERITELESLISRTENNSGADEASVLALNKAINVAEDLLDALATEQTKYENTDATGNTIEPLAKSLIAELESRKNDLVSRSFSQ
jgi:hypothetical protein